ncbi:unnamed protein product [Cylicocyclus nassatus]|uniref:Globin domain-containing protein n=1 Tax=Cylicocyclus nassatus TaxID=53992 RepID=A0AA36GQI8_CYLNA|nr:unnamed protein product [Cylicocyclus nassatus]
MGTSQSAEFSTRASSLRSKLGEPQVLTAYQKVILQTTWRHMSKAGQSSCANTIMSRLFIRDEQIKNVFHHNTMLNAVLGSDDTHCFQQHHREIIEFLQFVISNLDYPSKIAEKCHEIGVLHRKYIAMGMEAEHWDLLGEAITETIREFQGWKTHRESLRAANVIVSFVIDRIQTGFLQREVTTPNDAPTTSKETRTEVDRERSKSLQDAHKEFYRRQSTDSCLNVKDVVAALAPQSTKKKLQPIPIKSLPCFPSSNEVPVELRVST